MRWKYIIALQALIAVIAIFIGYFIKDIHADKVALVYIPPEEIAKWYKPESKRHVFLHTMFALRRELQAINKYAKEQSPERLDSWFEEFNKHYNKISFMVPSWQNKLDLTLLQQLNRAITSRQYSNIPELTSRIQRTCDSCHDKYQNITALTYRTPDFSKLKIRHGENYLKHMQKLTYLVNDIKINIQDDSLIKAKESLVSLTSEMTYLGNTCNNCHKGQGVEYPNEETKESVSQLLSAIDDGSKKDQSRSLGTLAVKACATCHGTHKIVNGAKKQIYKAKPITEWHR